jgi:hypothetical protein
MKEYQVIEDQEAKKRGKHKPNGVRKVSPYKKREVERDYADPTKLKPQEIPFPLLEKIDKLVRKQLKSLTDEDL